MLKRSGDASRIGDVSEILMQNPPLGTPLNFEHPMNKDLALHLAMNEGHGDVVRDLSLYGNHGTLKNMAFPSTPVSGWNPGRNGVGLNFDGANDYIDCGNNTSLDITDAITLSFWMKADAWDGWYWFIAKNDDSAATHGYFLGRNSNGNLNFCVGGKIASFEWTPGLEEWNLITGVFSPNTILQLYINNNPVGNNDGIPSAIIPYAQNLTIGKTLYYSSPYFGGSIADVRIYNRALSAKEIKDYYINPWQVYLQ